MKNWEQEARQLDDRCRQYRRQIEELEGERDEALADVARGEMRQRTLVQALAKYADHDNWPSMENDDGDDADPLWFDLQGEAVYHGWEPAESALIIAGLCKRDGDEVVEVERGTVWPLPAATSDATAQPPSGEENHHA